MLKRIVRRIRRAWLDANGVQFVTGLSPNSKLNELFALTILEAQRKHQQLGRPARTYGSAYYAAGTWESWWFRRRPTKSLTAPWKS